MVGPLYFDDNLGLTIGIGRVFSRASALSDTLFGVAIKASLVIGIIFLTDCFGDDCFLILKSLRPHPFYSLQTQKDLFAPKAASACVKVRSV